MAHTATHRATGDITPGSSVTEGIPTTRGALSREELVAKQVQTNLQAPQIPKAAVQTSEDIQIQRGETLKPTAPAFQVEEGLPEVTAAVAPVAGAVAPHEVTAATMEAAKTGAATAEAAQGDLDVAVSTAQVAGVSPEELVSFQLKQLTQGIESGDIPVWAQPAVDAVNAQLAARGLSASSVGRASLTNAILQTALPMAQQNAQTYFQRTEANLNRQQQTSLQNAQNRLQIASQNLSNEQQTVMANVQLKQQALLSNQSAENVARQFNASSQAQTDQFMANLTTTVDQNNAARFDAMSQFNANNVNTMRQFNSNINLQREQFNVQNATAIAQSNVQWRRQVNQINTAAQNAVNQANAMNAFNLSNQALTFMWQELRDAAKWSFEAAQNDEQRKVALATAAMGNEAATDANTVKHLSNMAAAAINLWSTI